MKKIFRNSLALTLLAVTAGSLSSCGVKRHNIEFWGSFGAAYSGHIERNVNAINAEPGHEDYDIHYTTKGSYDGIKNAVISSLSKVKYPDIMTGYPDHFASYLGNDILVQLNDLVTQYETKHGLAKDSLLKDYYKDYMDENYSIDLLKGTTDTAALSALPFNKSTELMGYNATFVNYCATINPELGVVPATWQEWKVKGPQYRDILYELCKNDKTGKVGHKLYFKVNDVKDGYDFSVDEKGDRGYCLDFTKVDQNQTRVITWDSTDNMFITLVRQWGSQYTKLDSEQLKQKARNRVGEILFNNSANRDKTVECLHFFNEMNKEKVFGVASQLGASYSSDGFAANKVMFMLCSSGGLSYNTNDETGKRFRVAPLPYYDDGVTQRKFVISQGADIAISNYCLTAKKGNPANIEKCFETIVELTTGEKQAKWCLNTGYYPCSESATNHPAYQEFLNSTDYEDSTKVAYREGSKLNEEEYMDKEKGWTKFVDPAFSKSSDIRLSVAKIFGKVFSDVNLETDSSLAAHKAQYESILTEIVNEYKNEKKVTWEGKN